MRTLTIIVSYNFMPWLHRCLHSLLSQTLPHDILIIDNGSTDQTIPTLQRDYPHIRLIANKQNLGFGQANNLGLRLALEEGYDAAFLLNQDAWLQSNCLTLLTRALQTNPVALLSPQHLDGTEQALDSAFAHYTGQTHITTGTQLQPAHFINAAFWLIPASTLRTVGLFSPLFFHCGEDVDYVNRLHASHLSLAWLPDARACHDRQDRAASPASRARGERVWHLAEYANPNYSLPQAFAHGILAPIKKGRIRLALSLLLLTPKVLRHRRAVSR